jgi:aspartate aminotransferase
VLPPALVEPVTRLVVNSVSCTSAHSQYAAIAALTGPWEPVERMVAELRGRREVIVDGLNRIPGLHCLRPEGAFYVFPSIADLGQPADEVERLLLRRAGVACLAGTAFGAGGEGFLRLSYANSVENIEAALDAIQATLAGP